MTQRYDTYKDSGVQWLGEIPGHWKTLLNGILFIEDVRKPETDDIPLSLSQVDGVIPTDEMKESSLKTSSYDNWKRVIVNDLVLNRFKAHLGVMFASNYVGMVSFHYGVFKAKMDLVPKYYEYLYHTNIYRFIYADASKGMTVGLQNLSNTSFYNVRAIYPPKDEQRSIVSFLDSKCGKIDEWVTKKQKEVEHLQELKQRVIADAVTRGLNPHAKMKSTNIPWLKEIPEHWEIYRYGTLFKLKPVKQHHGEELLSVFLHFGVIRAAESEKRTHAASEDLSKYQLVEETDFVMNNQQAWRGSVGVSKLVGIISPAYHIFKMPNCMFPDYANYLLRSKCMVSQFEMSSRGVGSIQRTLNFNWLNNKIVPVPPISEQRSIVSYLDSKCGMIDEWVTKKQKEVELLGELKQRLIADAVTRGLNPHVKMKPTNIPWLKEIPEHWDMSKISSHFRQRNEKVSDKDYPALSVSKQGVTPQLDNVALSNAEGTSRKLVKVGDYAVNSRSDRKGSCGVSKYEGSVSLITIVLEPFNINGEYVHFLFRSNPWVEEFYRNGRGIVADLWTTNYQMMKSMYMPVPPHSEQRSIVSYLDAKCSKIDKLIANVTKEIECIKEYKQRLISDVVTGQIKVC